MLYDVFIDKVLSLLDAEIEMLTVLHDVHAHDGDARVRSHSHRHGVYAHDGDAHVRSHSHRHGHDDGVYDRVHDIRNHSCHRHSNRHRRHHSSSGHDDGVRVLPHAYSSHCHGHEHSNRRCRSLFRADVPIYVRLPIYA